jgi:hypothetical protein
MLIFNKDHQKESHPILQDETWTTSKQVTRHGSNLDPPSV